MSVLQLRSLPQNNSFLQKTLNELRIGTYEDIAMVSFCDQCASLLGYIEWLKC